METSYTASSASPAVQLPTNRSLLKFVLLSIITLGIYGLVVMTKISTEINTIAGPYDNKKTMNYCLVVLIFSWLTMGIVPLVWATASPTAWAVSCCAGTCPISSTPEPSGCGTCWAR